MKQDSLEAAQAEAEQQRRGAAAQEARLRRLCTAKKSGRLAVSEAIARKFRQGDKERKALLQVFQKVGEDHDTRLQLDMCSKFVLRNRAFLFCWGL